jgi:hypothetical protein
MISSSTELMIEKIIMNRQISWMYAQPLFTINGIKAMRFIIIAITRRFKAIYEGC